MLVPNRTQELGDEQKYSYIYLFIYCTFRPPDIMYTVNPAGVIIIHGSTLMVSVCAYF